MPNRLPRVSGRRPITWRPIGELSAGTVKARRPRDSAGEAKRRALYGAEHSSNIESVMDWCQIVARTVTADCEVQLAALPHV